MAQAIEHVVYVLRAGETMRIKIGYTNDIARRVVELQVGCPELLVLQLAVPGSLQDENELKQRFAAYRRHGEWFDLSPEIEAWIEAARVTRSVR